jgi:hypothetical protein
VHGDTWALPVEKDYFSDNKAFVAHVTPAKGETKARLDVFEINDSNRVSIWKCTLGNEGAPMYVFVSNDGAYVVTVNEVSGRVKGGMGDYVLAFYNKGKLIKHYSLEQILHYPEKIDKTEFRKIAHRTSSGWHWAGRPMFFDKPDGKLHFCIWQVYGHRWLVWEVSSGREVKVDDKMVGRLNEKGCTWAREEVAKSRSRYWQFALKFLGRCKKAEDREIIESFLCSSGFHTNSRNYSSSSFKRNMAERILAKWDGRSSEVYSYLGIVEGTVELPRAPKVSDGWLCVYLIPEEIDKKNWHVNVPIQRYCLSFGKYSFGKDQWAGKVIPFKIKTVTPGKYWIKAVWDVAEPYSFQDDYIKGPPQNGDYHNVLSPEISVEAGETIDIGRFVLNSSVAGK